MQGGQGKDYAVSPHTSVSVPTTGVQLLPANSKRYYALIVNDSNRKVYLSFGELAAAGLGIPVYPGGFGYQIDRTNLFKGAIFARADTGTAVLKITEGQ